jgi:hypothetical protein
MLNRNTVRQTDHRKYLLVSKDQWLLLKGYGKHQKVSLAAITEHFLSLGLKRANELYMKEVIDDILRPRTDGLQYVISRQDKKYLVVSLEIHSKVTEFGRKRKLKLIEATRILIWLGMLAHFNVDPRNDPKYTSMMEISRLIIEQWQKNNPDKSIEKVLGPRYWRKMEADVLRDITFPGKKQSAASKQQRSEPTRKSRDKYSGLRDLVDLALIISGGFLLGENIKLKRENEELRRMIAGETTTGEKHNRPENSPTNEKQKETSLQSRDEKKQSSL